MDNHQENMDLKNKLTKKLMKIIYEYGQDVAGNLLDEGDYTYYEIEQRIQTRCEIADALTNVLNDSSASNYIKTNKEARKSYLEGLFSQTSQYKENNLLVRTNINKVLQAESLNALERSHIKSLIA